MARVLWSHPQLCYQVHVVRNHFLSNAIEISKKFCCDDPETIAAMGFNNSPENVFGEQAFLGSLRFLAISLLPYPFFFPSSCVSLFDCNLAIPVSFRRKLSSENRIS